MTKDQKNRQTAVALDSYLRFRAKQEQAEYCLSPTYFEQYLVLGVTKIYGVVIRNGKLIEDRQNAGTFEQWKLEQK